ncbi:uncharacterized protein LOC62_06G007932 [Vanrija pseudolonga]|uniref:Uncharacterized protein n=1 Tax=Vanrija pseudolonga TaxID=143232 RepID=A0AAF0YDI8_9TREE|nr:hypothetical protein LOC62_06G007932 [Vanrija pseudolonga]
MWRSWEGAGLGPGHTRRRRDTLGTVATPTLREKDGPGRSSSPGKYSSRAEPPVPPIPGDERRVSHATRGSVSNSASGSASASANATTLSSPARERPEVTFDAPPNGRHHTDDQEELNPEPLSPLRDPTNGADFSLSGARRGSAPAQTTNTHAFGPKQKGLPLPPVGPVMPDFNDLVPRRGSAVETTDSAVKRRPSIAKRFKERVGK